MLNCTQFYTVHTSGYTVTATNTS